MNPLDTFGFADPHMVRTSPAIAKRRFGQLRALDATEPARAELAAAGVPVGKINALYPFDFADYIPALAALMTPAALAQPLSTSTAARLTDLASSIMAALPARPSAALLTQGADPAFDDQLQVLFAAVRAALPKPGENMPSRLTAAATACTLLWYSFTFMANLDEYPELTLKVCSLFKRVSDLLLPHLRAAEQAEIAQLASCSPEALAASYGF